MAWHCVSRRDFMKTVSMAAAGLAAAPYLNCGKIGVGKPMMRVFGRLNVEVTTLGLGGQASLQWTPEGVDPIPIILKAFKLGVNYFDTSNAYGPSQMNYGKAFRLLHLIPDRTDYDEKLRRSIFLTSKSGLRWAKGGIPNEAIRNFGNGPAGSGTLDDVKRTLSQIFGDGEGSFPPGAYLDMVLIHNLNTMEEIHALYTGLADPDPKAEHIGALAALLDVRDGTNRTGLNPKEEKLIRHIGFSGHRSPAVNMEMIRRDNKNILDAMLVAINANDRLNFNMQYNVIPVAAARNMGIIAMKVFADGAMYTKEATWSRRPEHVVRTVGSPEMPSRQLVEYSLTVPGIHTAIIGTGHIDKDSRACQLKQNLSAAQITPEGLTASDHLEIEKRANKVKDGKTNYFQLPAQELTAPRDASIEQNMRGDARIIGISWNTAYAGNEPITKYEVWQDNQKIGVVDHKPQTGEKPFMFEGTLKDKSSHTYKIVTVDAAGRSAASGEIAVKAIG